MSRLERHISVRYALLPCKSLRASLWKVHFQSEPANILGHCLFSVFADVPAVATEGHHFVERDTKDLGYSCHGYCFAIHDDIWVEASIVVPCTENRCCRLLCRKF